MRRTRSQNRHLYILFELLLNARFYTKAGKYSLKSQVVISAFQVAVSFSACEAGKVVLAVYNEFFVKDQLGALWTV